MTRNPDLKWLRDSDPDGKLPAFAWPGGYPFYYLTADGDTLCPDCANGENDCDANVVSFGENWEDPDLYCDHCGRRIESAYAEDEANDAGESA